MSFYNNIIENLTSIDEIDNIILLAQIKRLMLKKEIPVKYYDDNKKTFEEIKDENVYLKSLLSRLKHYSVFNEFH